MERLREINDLQDNVDTLEQKVKNLTKQSRDADLKSAKTKQVDAQRRATEAAKARVAAEEHAAAEAEVATRAQRVADAARADEQDMGEQLKSAQKASRVSEESKQNMSQ